MGRMGSERANRAEARLSGSSHSAAAPLVTPVSNLEQRLVERLEHRMKELEALKPGWYDGEGEAPSKEALDWLQGILLEMMEQHSLPYPTLFPMPEGGIEADWRIRPWYVTAEFDLMTRSAYLHAAQVESGEVETLTIQFLEGTNEPLAIFARFVKRFIFIEDKP
jgi:hypothetical protein